MQHSPIKLPPREALGAVPAALITAAIDQLIEALDERDGDPDLELSGLEDDFMVHEPDGPGCPVSDTAEAAWIERTDQARRPLPTAWIDASEDAEDDDPAGGNVTDEPHDEHDEGNAELAAWPERIDQTQFPDRLDGWSGSSVHEDEEDDDPDTGVEDDPLGFDPEQDCGAEDLGEEAGEGDVCRDSRPIADPEAYRAHLKRIREQRCFRTYRRERFIGRNDEGRSILQERRVPAGHRLFVEPVAPSKRSLLKRKRGLPARPRP